MAKKEPRDLQSVILKAGVKNCIFFLPMSPLRSFLFFKYTSSSDLQEYVRASIVETKYKVSERYKITLRADVPGFGRCDFYICDLESMIKEGSVEFYIKGEIGG